ncbi:MAG: hypothetical protein ABIG61_01505 [Planctomycetota bacterium]
MVQSVCISGNAGHGILISSNCSVVGNTGENIGWINFGLTDYYSVACKVIFEDSVNFVEDGLKTGPGWPADLHSDGNIDFKDYGIFADYWLDFCPDEWPLK